MNRVRNIALLLLILFCLFGIISINADGASVNCNPHIVEGFTIFNESGIVCENEILVFNYSIIIENATIQFINSQIYIQNGTDNNTLNISGNSTISFTNSNLSNFSQIFFLSNSSIILDQTNVSGITFLKNSTTMQSNSSRFSTVSFEDNSTAVFSGSNNITDAAWFGKDSSYNSNINTISGNFTFPSTINLTGGSKVQITYSFYVSSINNTNSNIILRLVNGSDTNISQAITDSNGYASISVLYNSSLNLSTMFLYIDNRNESSLSLLNSSPISLNITCPYNQGGIWTVANFNPICTRKSINSTQINIMSNSTATFTSSNISSINSIFLRENSSVTFNQVNISGITYLRNNTIMQSNSSRFSTVSFEDNSTAVFSGSNNITDAAWFGKDSSYSSNINTISGNFTLPATINLTGGSSVLISYNFYVSSINRTNSNIVLRLVNGSNTNISQGITDSNGYASISVLYNSSLNLSTMSLLFDNRNETTFSVLNSSPVSINLTCPYNQGGAWAITNFDPICIGKSINSTFIDVLYNSTAYFNDSNISGAVNFTSNSTGIIGNVLFGSNVFIRNHSVVSFLEKTINITGNLSIEDNATVTLNNVNLRVPYINLYNNSQLNLIDTIFNTTKLELYSSAYLSVDNSNLSCVINFTDYSKGLIEGIISNSSIYLLNFSEVNFSDSTINLTGDLNVGDFSTLLLDNITLYINQMYTTHTSETSFQSDTVFMTGNLSIDDNSTLAFNRTNLRASNVHQYDYSTLRLLDAIFNSTKLELYSSAYLSVEKSNLSGVINFTNYSRGSIKGLNTNSSIYLLNYSEVNFTDGTVNVTKEVHVKDDSTLMFNYTNLSVYQIYAYNSSSVKIGYSNISFDSLASYDDSSLWVFDSVYHYSQIYDSVIFGLESSTTNLTRFNSTGDLSISFSANTTNYLESFLDFYGDTSLTVSEYSNTTLNNSAFDMLYLFANNETKISIESLYDQENITVNIDSENSTFKLSLVNSSFNYSRVYGRNNSEVNISFSNISYLSLFDYSISNILNSTIDQMYIGENTTTMIINSTIAGFLSISPYSGSINLSNLWEGTIESNNITTSDNSFSLNLSNVSVGNFSLIYLEKGNFIIDNCSFFRFYSYGGNGSIANSNITGDAWFNSFNVVGFSVNYNPIFVNISNSSINSMSVGRNSSINFTSQSVVNNFYEIGREAYDNVSISGYFNITNDSFLIRDDARIYPNSVLTRNYPMYIYYPNGSVANSVLVKILNGSTVAYSGTTDSSGFIIPRLQFSNSSIHFKYSINVSGKHESDIGLNNDTLMNITMRDNIKPLINISINGTDSSLPHTGSTITFHLNVSDDAGIQSVWYIIDDLDDSNTSINNSVNATFFNKAIEESVSVGTHNVTVYASDYGDNINYTTRTFYVNSTVNITRYLNISNVTFWNALSYNISNSDGTEITDEADESVFGKTYNLEIKIAYNSTENITIRFDGFLGSGVNWGGNFTINKSDSSISNNMTNQGYSTRFMLNVINSSNFFSNTTPTKYAIFTESCESYDAWFYCPSAANCTIDVSTSSITATTSSGQCNATVSTFSSIVTANDIRGPAINITSPSSEVTNTSYINVEATISESSKCWYNITNSSNSSLYSYVQMGNSITSYDHDFDYPLRNGTYTINMICNDTSLAKNTNSTTKEFTISDTKAPIFDSFNVDGDSCTSTSDPCYTYETEDLSIIIETDEPANCYNVSSILKSPKRMESEVPNTTHTMTAPGPYSVGNNVTFYFNCTDINGYTRNKNYSVIIEEQIEDDDNPSSNNPNSITGQTIGETNRYTQVWSALSSGHVVLMNITKTTIPVSQISFTLGRAVATMSMSIESIVAKPEPVSLPSDSLYRYIKLVVNQITSSDASSIKLKFKVEKSWINTNNIDYNTIKMQRYGTNSWQTLITTMVGSDSTYYLYEASSPGFSYYAITGKSTQSATPTANTTAPTAPIVTPNPNNQDNQVPPTDLKLGTTGNETDTNTTSTGFVDTIKNIISLKWPIWVLIVGFLTVIAIFVYEKKIKKMNFGKKEDLPFLEDKPSLPESHKIEKPVEKETAPIDRVVDDNDLLSIEKYIEAMLERGKNMDECKKELVEVGWDEEKVDMVFHKVHIPHEDITKIKIYYDTKISQGKSRKEILDNLLEVGWDKKLINTALSEEDFQKLDAEELYVYIEDKLNKNVPEPDIMQTLVRAGWNDKKIMKVMIKIKKEKANKKA